MQGSLDRVEARMSLANEYLAKQIAWMGRLAALDLRGSPEAEELMRTLSSTRGLLGSGPDLIARERQAALAEVDRQLQMTLADVDRQRRATLALLSGERAILLQAVAHERALVLAAVDEQRRLAVQGGDSLLARLVAEEIRVVDHLLLRVAALFGVLLLVLGAWSLLRRYRVPAPIR